MEQWTLNDRIAKSREIFTACDQLTKNYGKHTKKYGFFMLIFFLMIIAAAVGAGWYAKSHDKNWFMILLFAFLGGAAAYVVWGIIILVCKPFLFLHRKNSIKLLDELSAEENCVANEKRSLLECYINNTPAQRPRWDNIPRKNRLSVSEMCEGWTAAQESVLYYRDVIRRTRLDEDKYNEWYVILSSIVIVIFGILFVIAFYAFLVAIILFAVYLSLRNRNDDRYRYHEKDNNYGREEDSRESFTSLITGRVKDRIESTEFYLKFSNEQLEEAEQAANEYLDELIEFYYPNMDKDLVDILRCE